MAVVFFNVQKDKKRSTIAILLNCFSNIPQGWPENTITERHVRRLEEIIRAQP